MRKAVSKEKKRRVNALVVACSVLFLTIDDCILFKR
jgi:hypothetical protein